jgi:hypothetical protein
MLAEDRSRAGAALGPSLFAWETDQFAVWGVVVRQSPYRFFLGKGVGMAHPNEDLVRKGFDAFSKGDMDVLRNEVFAADVKYHVPGKSPVSGDYRRIEGFR